MLLRQRMSLCLWPRALLSNQGRGIRCLKNGSSSGKRPRGICNIGGGEGRAPPTGPDPTGLGCVQGPSQEPLSLRPTAGRIGSRGRLSPHLAHCCGRSKSPNWSYIMALGWITGPLHPFYKTQLGREKMKYIARGYPSRFILMSYMLPNHFKEAVYLLAAYDYNSYCPPPKDLAKQGSQKPVSKLPKKLRTHSASESLRSLFRRTALENIYSAHL